VAGANKKQPALTCQTRFSKGQECPLFRLHGCDCGIAIGTIPHSIHNLRVDVFAAGTPFERQSRSEASARCKSIVLDADCLAEGYAFVHDGDSIDKPCPNCWTGAMRSSVADWTQEASELPSWDQARRRLVEQGQPSKVRFPSSDQIARRIPEPRSSEQ
jgi:hypothetical protein